MNWNRLLSSIVALAYLTVAVMVGGGETALKTALFLILPMAGTDQVSPSLASVKLHRNAGLVVSVASSA